MITTGMNQQSILIILIICLHTVIGLTTSDFYKDPNSKILLQFSDDEGNGHRLELPITITNIKSYPSIVYNKIDIMKGKYVLQAVANYQSATYILRPKYSNILTAGSVTVKYTQDSNLLLARAQKDISAYDANAPMPTLLILMDNTDIGGAKSKVKSTFQAVFATDGQYSYLIIQFVSIEPDAYWDKVYMDGVDFPYAEDISNAPYNSNVGVPGKYVIDLNEVKPSPALSWPCSCVCDCSNSYVTPNKCYRK